MTPEKTEIRYASSEAGGASIGGVTLGRELGRGGMAIVYEGMDLGFSPPRHVAVKLMAPNLSADPEFRTRFEREASLVAGFRHDNIVHVFASGDAGGAKYIIMEYLSGGSLAARIAQGAVPAGAAIAAAAVLADALAYSHARGVVHRDFKPGNVLFTTEGKPVLSDFGIAKSASSLQTALTQYSAVIGAPRYMAPEQARGLPVDDRADVFSFGLTLYEMLMGRLPPPEERELQCVRDGRQITAALRNLPPNVAGLVCSCLLCDPAARPSARNCADVLTAVSSEAEFKTGASARRPIVWGAWAILAGVLAWSLLKVGLPPSDVIDKARSSALSSQATLMNRLRDLELRRKQLAQQVRDSENAAEQLNARFAGAASESERRILQQPLADAQVAALDANLTRQIVEQQILTPQSLEVIRSDQSLGNSDLNQGKTGEADKAWRDGAERARILLDAIDSVRPAMLEQRQFSQLDQKAAAIITATGGVPQRVLLAPEQLAQRASQALSAGDSLRARNLFASASLDAKTRMQSFLRQVIANYGIIAQRKTAANDLDTARAAIDRAKSLRSVLSQL